MLIFTLFTPRKVQNYKNENSNFKILKFKTLKYENSNF